MQRGDGSAGAEFWVAEGVLARLVGDDQFTLRRGRIEF